MSDRDKPAEQPNPNPWPPHATPKPHQGKPPSDAELFQLPGDPDEYR